MANWVQVPGGPIINFDFVQGVSIEGTAITIHTAAGPQVINYATVSQAATAYHIISNAVASAVPGSATLVSVSPNSVPAASDSVLTIVGTNFLPSAAITIGGFSIFSGNVSVLSGTTIQVQWLQFTLVGGVYDVDYADASGGSATLPASFTIT